MSKYPEKLPEESKPLSKFTFSLNVATSVKKELQDQFDSITDRIENIINKVTIDGMPMIRLVLQSTHNKKELKKLAKGIDRIADLIEVQDNLKSRLSIIDTAQKDPEWFAWTFGDFSDEIEKDLTSIFEEDNYD
jgi:hypothetical protein